jgi:methionine biosynthesis protein MetW
MDYEEYWKLRSADSGMRPRFLVIEKWIRENSEVLSIGCGDGLLEGYLIEKKNCEVTGVDVSATALEKAKERGVKVLQRDLNLGLNLPPETQFDYVVCSEILEHLPFPERILTEIRTLHLFRDNLICTIPNIAHFRHRFRLLLGRFPVQYAFDPSEHLRFWSIPDFLAFADGLGFRVLETEASNGFIDYYGSSRKLRLHKWWPNLFGNQICFKLDYKDK